MATKAKKPAVKKEAEKQAAPKAEKKSLKTAAKAPEVQAPAAPVTPEGVDAEELEEQMAEAAATSSGGSEAALAAATSATPEMSASFKNFRHHPDMENFYRFIYENDLRHEALTIIDQIMSEKGNRKAIRAARAQAH